ncbi:MAG: 50S ribosome-binding GTPase [Candidatus Lokiarchaeota archaeon]|nr:50S ribosome-binding GTPase [Candidatus Lokiarchaeota archaeon]
MKILILSHFDARVGPVPFLFAPKTIDEKILDQIPDLMNLFDENGFFVHIVGGFKSANLVFEIPNPHSRGKVEMLLISVLITEGDLNIELAKELLQRFSVELNNIDDAYQAFYPQATKNGTLETKHEEINSLFKAFYDSFPEESFIKRRKDAKIFVFGLSKAGKTTIIKTLQNSELRNTIPTTSIGISRIYLNNLSILAYDAPGQSKFRNMWTDYLKKQNGLVFVLDASRKEKYSSARDILHHIAGQEDMKDLPLLLLYNKVDLYSPKIEEINQLLEINKLNRTNLKSFLTTGFDSSMINDAFSWLSQQLLSLVEPTESAVLKEKIGEGIIFSIWDDTIGLEVIGVYPINAFSDPEVLAINCFSISQTIFGGDKFKKISVIFPFVHLKAKIAIYFDYVEHSTVRGGKLPLSMLISFKEEVPNEFIHQLDSVVFNELTKIKPHYSEKEKIKNDLKNVFEMISEIRKSGLFTLGGAKNVPLDERSTKSTITTFQEYFEAFGNKSDLSYLREIQPSYENESHCSICYEEFKERQTIIRTASHLIKVCDTCLHEITLADINMIHQMFLAYGGYFGMKKTQNGKDENIIAFLRNEIKSKKNGIDPIDRHVKVLHESLLLGIYPERFKKDVLPYLRT